MWYAVDDSGRYVRVSDYYNTNESVLLERSVFDTSIVCNLPRSNEKPVFSLSSSEIERLPYRFFKLGAKDVSIGGVVDDLVKVILGIGSQKGSALSCTVVSNKGLSRIRTEVSYITSRGSMYNIPVIAYRFSYNTVSEKLVASKGVFCFRCDTRSVNGVHVIHRAGAFCVMTKKQDKGYLEYLSELVDFGGVVIS